MRNTFSPKFGELPATLPLFPLEGAVVLPHGQLPLNIFEPRYLNMVFDALADARLIGMIQPLPDSSIPEPALHQTGCAGRIVSFSETRDGRLLIVLGGLCRFDVVSERTVERGYRLAEISWSRFCHDLKEEQTELESGRLLAAAKHLLEHRSMTVEWEALDELGTPELIDTLGSSLPFSPQEKQGLVETKVLQDRLNLVTALCEFSSALDSGASHRTH